MLKIAISKGSLEKGTFSLFDQAELTIKKRNERDYNISINDPRISKTILLHSPETALYVGRGNFDLGVTGRDRCMDMQVNVVEVLDLQFSRGGWNKLRLVLGTNNENPISLPEEISENSLVVSEFENITRCYLDKLGKSGVRVERSWGATEAKVPELADYFVDVVDTGETLLQNGKKIIATIMESTTLLIANKNSWSDPIKRQAIEEIAGLLSSVLEARDKILLKMNVERSNLENLVNALPSMNKPTISRLSKKGWLAVEAVVVKSTLNVLIPKIKKIGAVDILELGINKVIP